MFEEYRDRVASFEEFKEIEEYFFLIKIGEGEEQERIQKAVRRKFGIGFDEGYDEAFDYYNYLLKKFGKKAEHIWRWVVEAVVSRVNNSTQDLFKGFLNLRKDKIETAARFFGMSYGRLFGCLEMMAEYSREKPDKNPEYAQRYNDLEPAFKNLKGNWHRSMKFLEQSWEAAAKEARQEHLDPGKFRLTHKPVVKRLKKLSKYSGINQGVVEFFQQIHNLFEQKD